MLVDERRGITMAVTQPQGQEQAVPVQQAQRTIPVTTAQPGTNQEEFLGIGTALKRQGYLNYEPITVAAELSLQRDIQGNPTKQAVFQEFATNYTQMRVYLAMVGEQKTVTMIHMIGAFYSIRAATKLYQGKILGFIGDWRATKEPMPVCLPQNKAWQWCVAQANTDKEDFMTFYESEGNTNNWWTPSSALTNEVKAPYLLALPNEMVEILRESGAASMPADVLGAIDNVNQAMNVGLPEDQWKSIVDWCIIAGQSDANDQKSLLSIKVDSVAVDDKEFNMWVANKLDMALGPRPSKTPPVRAGNQPQFQDYLQMLQLLASTVGQGMMQFSQAVATQAATRGAASTGQGAITPLKVSKGFDRDQIAKLKDACSVMSAKDIPNIWFVI
jgi:hypothetical protein